MRRSNLALARRLIRLWLATLHGTCVRGTPVLAVGAGVTCQFNSCNWGSK